MPPPPIRPRLLQYYSRNFYHTRVKPRFDEAWEKIVNAPIPEGEKAPAVIKIRNRVTEEAWRAETTAFQAEVEVSLEKEFQAQKKAYDALLEEVPDKTAEDYDM